MHFLHHHVPAAAALLTTRTAHPPPPTELATYSADPCQLPLAFLLADAGWHLHALRCGVQN